MAETKREQERWKLEGYFEKYFVGKGIDIGCGDDPITSDCDKWDQRFGQTDAAYMLGVQNEKYDWVFSSHCLEHLWNPDHALENWCRILKPMGHMVLLVPHREYYEKKKRLPSNGNPDHKFFILPFESDPPHTFGIVPLIMECAPELEILSVRVILPPAYSIEIIARKKTNLR